MKQIISCLLILAFVLTILFVKDGTSSYVLIIPLAMLGFGMAFVMMNLATFGMARLEGAAKTDGTALMTCLRTIGGALGTAGFVSIMSIGVQNQNYTMSDVHRSYVGMAVLAVIAVVLAVGFIKGKSKKAANAAE